MALGWMGLTFGFEVVRPDWKHPGREEHAGAEKSFLVFLAEASAAFVSWKHKAVAGVFEARRFCFSLEL